MDALPHWPEGTVAVLTTHPAHAIPVSLALRAGDRELLIGLAPRRRSLEHLRADPRCAVTVLTRPGSSRIPSTPPWMAAR